MSISCFEGGSLISRVVMLVFFSLLFITMKLFYSFLHVVCVYKTIDSVKFCYLLVLVSPKDFTRSQTWCFSLDLCHVVTPLRPN